MRNIIICCDGTGNEISENISNVLKLYRCLRKTEKTRRGSWCFTIRGSARWRGRIRGTSSSRISTRSWGSPPAMGSMTTCSRPMPSWSHTWQTGDQIYLFGFSRGAYTVRVLAGLIHKIGLITPEQVNLAGSGLIAYKQFSSDEAPKLRAKFKSAHRCRRRGGCAAALAVRQRRAVRAHHLVALAHHPLRRRLGYGRERDRAAAGSLLLAEPGRAGLDAAEPERADVPAGDLDRRAPLHVPPEEVGRAADLQARPLQRGPCRAAGYFAGVVRRRACRYRRRLSRKGKRAFQISAAVDDRRGRRNAGSSSTRPTSTSSPGAFSARAARTPMSCPTCAATCTIRCRGAWWLLEYLPKSAKYREWPARKAHFGYYIPDAEPRLIPEGAIIHRIRAWSAWTRCRATGR